MHTLQLQKYLLFENVLHLCIREHTNSCFMHVQTLIHFLFFFFLNTQTLNHNKHNPPNIVAYIHSVHSESAPVLKEIVFAKASLLQK